VKVADPELLAVSSRRGTIDLKARVADIVLPKVVLTTFQYEKAVANKLTTDALDPISKVMEAKLRALKV